METLGTCLWGQAGKEIWKNIGSGGDNGKLEALRFV